MNREFSEGKLGWDSKKLLESQEADYAKMH